MQGHMRRHHTRTSTHISDDIETPMPADDMIKKLCGNLPEWAVALRGLRYREGLTQTALGEMLGIAQTNISQMELGKRSIGKNIAKRLANLFHTNYKIFL